MEGSAIFLPPSWQLLPAAFGVLIVLLAFPGGVSGLWFTARDRLLERAARRREPPTAQSTRTARMRRRSRRGRADGPSTGR